MLTIYIHEAKTYWSRLIARAVKGAPFSIAKTGTPLVKESRLDWTPTKTRLGFLKGEFEIPKDFDEMGKSEIEKLFTGDLFRLKAKKAPKR